MKTIFSVVLLVTSLTIGLAFAQELDLERSSQVTGRGRSFGTCQADTFSSCQMMLGEQAKEDGRRDAGTQCQYSGGHLTNPYLYCQSTCSPLMAPPPPQTTPIFTNCDATCYGDCEYPSDSEAADL